MSARRLIPIGLAITTLLVPGAVGAKGFEPGDLRICNAKRCAPIMSKPAVAALSRFYYTGVSPPRRAPRVALGAQAFELRFENGYVTGIVAAANLDRFLSYGVNLRRFAAGRWYRMPPTAARELRRLAAGFRPLRVTRAALGRSR